jgi:hypothetical protein
MLWSSRMAGFPDLKVVVAFMFFVVNVVTVSSHTTTDAKGVKESLGFRLMSVKMASA